MGKPVLKNADKLRPKLDRSSAKTLAVLDMLDNLHYVNVSELK